MTRTTTTKLFLFPLLVSLVFQHAGGAITSRHGSWSHQLDKLHIKRGVINPSNSTQSPAKNSPPLNAQVNNQLAITNSSNHQALSSTSSNSGTNNLTNNINNQTRVASVKSGPKLVFAHFIAGLTYDYTSQHWLDDISLAASHGIDAFALNVGVPDSWQVNQVSTAYDVATKVQVTSSGKSFKLFLSLDMSVIQTTDQVSAWISKFSQMDSQLLVDGKVFVSTFSGENKLFGANNLTTGWTTAVRRPLAALNPPMDAMFVPVWSGLDPNTAVSSNPVVDGIMTWKAWPTASEAMSTMVDLEFQADAIKNKKYYMAAVSPCFYTHYSDKNFIFRSDDNLYLNRWKELIAMATQPDFIQIISWNDYGESHYIGPVSGSPPDGTTWIRGFDHQAWLDMSDYFIQWYKTGSPPTITQDKVYYSYRPHSVSATASSDPYGLPTNASTTTDAIYLAAFLSAGSSAQKLKVSIGNMTQVLTSLNLGSISTFQVPWNGASGAVQVELLDGSDNSLLVSKAQNPINNSIKRYNFNYASELLVKGGFHNDPKSQANSSSSSMTYFINPWMSFLGMTIVLLSNLA